MTDIELIELAAKAAGIQGRVIEGVDEFNFWLKKLDRFSGQTWAPLTDDGDALRLAVKLKIDAKHYEDHVVAWFDGGYIGTGKIPYESDPYAATRRAIVRAAAEIGKAMP